jgi:outer membrane protein
MDKLKTLLLSLLFTAFATTLYSQKLWSLEDCIYHAYKNNIQIKQSELGVESAEKDYLQRKLNMVPSLNTGYSYNFGWGRSVDMATYRYTNQKTQQGYFNVNSSFTLFSGMQQINSLRQQQFEMLAQQYNYEKIKNDMSLNIAAAYLQILFNIELVKNAEGQVKITKLQIDRTKKEVEAGTVAKGNLLDIEAQGASEEANLVAANNRLKLAYIDLMQLLDIIVNDSFDIEKPELKVELQKNSTESPEFIYNKALTIMPEIKSAEYQLKSAEKSLKVSKGARFPTLTMNGGYGTNYSDQIKKSYDPTNPDFNKKKSYWDQWVDNRNFTLDFRLNIPIFNGYQATTKVRKAKINYENISLNLELEKNRLRKNIEQAYADAVAAYQTYLARKKSYESLKESFKYTEEKFNVGMVNSTDYNLSKIQLSKAESDLVSAKYDYIFKTRILNFYLGKPLTLKDVMK